MKPRKGPEEGGTVVAITGSNFTGAFAVKFGGVPAKSFEVNPDRHRDHRDRAARAPASWT